MYWSIKGYKTVKGCTKIIWRNPTPIFDKNFQQSKNLMELSQSRNGNGIYENL